MSSCRLLLVDDELPIRMALSANLELEGFEVSEAEDAESALALATQQEFDVILTDIRMPGMSGVDLFNELRKRGKRTPVVLMTAFAQEDVVDAALENGAFALLSKPFDVEHAIRTISTAARYPVVLVVDTPPNAAATRAALEATGLRVRTEQSADSAVQAMKDGDVDVCVVDLGVSREGGADLAKRLRALDKSVTIIAVSSEEVPDVIRQVAAIGMYTYLRKPFDVRHLVRAIATARGANGAERARLVVRS